MKSFTVMKSLATKSFPVGLFPFTPTICPGNSMYLGALYTKNNENGIRIVCLCVFLTWKG